jgi:RNA polymerase sigma factor (sigma-70 family)
MSAEEVIPEVSDLEDVALQAKAGNKEARAALYLRLQGFMEQQCAAAKRLLAKVEQARGGVGGPIEADDLDQQLFLIFCSLLEDWEPERGRFMTYLGCTIGWRAQRYVRDTLHMRSRRVVLVRASQIRRRNTEGEAPGAPLGFGEDEVLSSEAWQELTAQLREDWKRFVDLRFYEDLSSGRIARIAHCSERTVNRHLKSALDQIRSHLTDEWEAN